MSDHLLMDKNASYDTDRWEPVKIRVPVITGQSMDEAYQVALRVADRHYDIFTSHAIRRFKGEWHVTFIVKKGFRRP